MKQLEFHLSFLQTQWICTGNDISISADSLDQIDELLQQKLEEKYKNTNINVKMYFDFDRFPTWMRQYMPHYFNRSIVYNL